MCEKRYGEKGWTERSLGDGNEEGNESVNQKGSLICYNALTVFRKKIIFELEREKVRSEVWRKEEELIQDRRETIMVGKECFCVQSGQP